MKTVKFRNQTLILVKGKYLNGNTALLLETKDGEPYDTLTANFNELLDEDEVYIKDYSENTGVYDMLKTENVIIKEISKKVSGFVELPLCKIDLTIFDKECSICL